jgi:hypothetical protein
LSLVRERAAGTASAPRAKHTGGQWPKLTLAIQVLLARDALTIASAITRVARGGIAPSEVAGARRTVEIVSAAEIFFLTGWASLLVVTDAPALVPLALLGLFSLADIRAAVGIVAAALAADIDAAKLVELQLLFLVLLGRGQVREAIRNPKTEDWGNYAPQEAAPGRRNAERAGELIEARCIH